MANPLTSLLQGAWNTAAGVASGAASAAVNNPLNTLGALGQIASTESAISRLRDLGAEGKEAIGMPTGSIYDTVAGATQFKPFSVYSLPGSVTTTGTGGTTFNLSPEQQALEASLRTGGQSLYDMGIMGRGQGAIDPATGLPTDDARAEQSALLEFLQQPGYRLNQQNQYMEAFRDPFQAPALAAGEQTLFDRMREIRMPEEERARVALQQQLVAGGRQGLQTAQYGGSPESFALNQAFEEQKSKDALAAMDYARQDAQRYADQGLAAFQEGRTDQELASTTRLRALQQQMQEKQTAGQIAEGMIAGSYRPTEALIAQTQPSLNLADLATVAGRQLGGYGSELGRASLDYDLGAEGAGANLRNQLLQGLFGMLTKSGQTQPPININLTGGGGGSNTAANVAGGFGIPSDIRLKENIKPLGKVNEVNVYSWDWNEKGIELGADKYPTVGVIAQEVIKTRPDAAWLKNGYYVVDYNKALGERPELI